MYTYCQEHVCKIYAKFLNTRINAYFRVQQNLENEISRITDFYLTKVKCTDFEWNILWNLTNLIVREIQKYSFASTWQYEQSTTKHWISISGEIFSNRVANNSVRRYGTKRSQEHSVACLAMHRYLHCPLSFPRMTEEFGVGSRGPGQAIQASILRKFQSLFARVSQKNDDESVPADWFVPSTKILRLRFTRNRPASRFRLHGSATKERLPPSSVSLRFFTLHPLSFPFFSFCLLPLCTFSIAGSSIRFHTRGVH